MADPSWVYSWDVDGNPVLAAPAVLAPILAPVLAPVIAPIIAPVLVPIIAPEIAPIIAPVITPPGIIVMWAGLIAAIPVGWLLCDGTLGTPDLRGRFIKGALLNPGGTGGSPTHTHELPFAKVVGATGRFRYLSSLVFGTGTTRLMESQSAQPVADVTMQAVELAETVNSEPEYYTLAFLQKI